jgi:hypothetical protein
VVLAYGAGCVPRFTRSGADSIGIAWLGDHNFAQTTTSSYKPDYIFV